MLVCDLKKNSCSFLQYLDKIGEQFYGVRQTGKLGAGGLLGLLSGVGESNDRMGKRRGV